MDTPISNLCEEVNPEHPDFSIYQWFQNLKDAAKDIGHPYLTELMETMPEDLGKVGKTHIILPDADNVTEDMLDAPRRVLLYTDAFSDCNAASIRKMLTTAEHYARHIPSWFGTMEGHMTKADRLHLMYAMNIAGYKDPEPPYVPRNEKPAKQMFTLSIYLQDNPKCLTISRAYEPRWNIRDIELLDIQINRHELPEDWRFLFRKPAVDMGLKLTKKDGVYSIDTARIRLGIKAEYVDKVRYEIDDGAKAKN